MVASSHHLRPSIEKGWSFSIPLAVPLEGYTTITSIQYFHCLQTAPPCMTSADDEYLGIKYLMRSFASVTFESSTPRPKFPLSLQRPFTKKYVPVHKNMCVTAFLHTDFCAMTQKSVWDSLQDPDDSHRTINLRCDTSWKLASISGWGVRKNVLNLALLHHKNIEWKQAEVKTMSHCGIKNCERCRVEVVFHLQDTGGIDFSQLPDPT
jgi:hypothetical protein